MASARSSGHAWSANHSLRVRTKRGGNPVRLRAVAGDQDMAKRLAEHQGLEGVGREMGAPIAHQKLQLRRQEQAQGFDDHLGGDLRSGDETRQAQALPGAVVNDD